MPHLSELHGAATHLAVVAVPLYALLMILRRFGIGGRSAAAAEPWTLAAAAAGIALAGLTGLLVHGQAETTLRGSDAAPGVAHFWLGFVLAALVAAGILLRWRGRAVALIATVAVLATGVVAVQGYLGGRITYDDGVGVDQGGQMARSARGAADLEVALARGAVPAAAGRTAFARAGLGCASCHGDLAQGDRGPALAGGRDLADFRRVHGHGLFPPTIVTDRDFAAIDAYLARLAR